MPASADMFFVVLFLAIYYIRPQDWVPGLIGFSVVKPIILLGFFSLVNRDRGLSPGDFFKTPIDWAVFFYAVYIVLTAPDLIGAFKAVIPLFAFYWLTVIALDSEEKMLRYMKWWTTALLILAGFGVAQLYGVDFTGGVDRTDFFKGRLALGTWTHDNPNALGHSVVVAIPMAYFLMFWKSTFSRRVIAVLLVLLAGYAAKETQSKGAFLVGGAGVVLAMIFGRPKFVQILILSAAFAGGGAVMALLPRMNEMNSIGSDEGVQGRMMAWEIARTASRNNTYGEGYKQFQAYIRWTDGAMYPKATHGSYVRLGADLGYPGLFLFLLILWCNLRVLVALKTNNLDFERCRRMLFLLLATYVLSGWMIDRCYHTEYFLLAACCAAMHRIQIQSKKNSMDSENDDEENVASSNWDAAPEFPLPIDSNTRDHASRALQMSKSKLQQWQRLGFLDLCAASLFLWATLALWDYILKSV